MILPNEISKKFLKSYTDVLKVVSSHISNEFIGFAEARDELMTKKSKYINEIKDDEIKKSIINAKMDNFIVVKLGKRKNVFMDTKSKFHIVVGVTQELCDILNTWEIIKTTVLDYNGYKICDGLIWHTGIKIGRNIEYEILDDYKNISKK